MSHTAQDLAIAHIPGSRSLVSDPAPVKLGQKHGYFKDREVKALLGLSKGNFLEPMALMEARSSRIVRLTFPGYKKAPTIDVCYLSFWNGEEPCGDCS